MRSVFALRITFWMELVLETQENKSLLKKILYVVVTLLPMAIYMVVYMPTFFWVEGLDHGGNFHIILSKSSSSLMHSGFLTFVPA